MLGETKQHCRVEILLLQEWQMDREDKLLSSLVWKVPLPGELELDGPLGSLSIQTIL